MKIISNWEPKTAWIKAVRRYGERFPLLVLLMAEGNKKGEYVVMALEAHSKDVLAAHSHKLLGTFKGKARAVKAANEFAKDWGVVKANSATCECGEIEGEGKIKADCGHETDRVYSADNGKRFCEKCYLDVFRRKCSQCGRAFGRDEIGCSVCR